MFLNRAKNTYSVLFHFIILFLFVSFLLRCTFLIISFYSVALNFVSILQIFGLGFIYDLGVASFFALPYAFYLLVLPSKWSRSILNKIFTYLFFFLSVFIIMFSFFAEFTFWQEFQSRFNFIAVDYLIYTYEVIENINESYSLPLLISGMLALTLIVMWIFYKRKYFLNTFYIAATFRQRVIVTIISVTVTLIYALAIKDSYAEISKNRYNNELAKAGIYSFFAAYKNNELNYEYFYKLIDNKEAFTIIRKQLEEPDCSFLTGEYSIRRKITDTGNIIMPNVIMITIESLSADFMAHFGNKSGLTSVLDSIADKSILFANMYATGTRTVRGMEALSLAIPPTSGSSIVRRPDNENLTTIGYIFQQKRYQTGFFYGGDGYFDNMNQYFGSNGYIVNDRRRNNLMKDKFKAPRINIPDSVVHFENAWGICDEDLYDVVIKDADENFSKGKLFYDFVMTTSNHKPYTYPSNKIDIPSGTGRDGAIKYTDYAIGQFLEKISKKKWFSNTIIIFVADHCANSAGKNEIDITKYHIPAIVYNFPDHLSFTIKKMSSQIDLYPTLFGLLNWEYISNLYGQNVLSSFYQQRILLGTYQKLGYMKNDDLVILGSQQKVETYKYNKDLNEQIPVLLDNRLIKEAIANYQTAYYLFKNAGLKQ